MSFNSLEFLIFFPIVFCLYWFVFKNKLREQNLLLLFSSYIFYGWWDWRFLSLIFLSTIIDYFVGLKIYDSNNKKNKKLYLWISIVFNLSLLGFFKYFNFFIESWVSSLSLLGYEYQSNWTINIILPLGISFYTFQTMSYSLDIYYKKIKPTKDFISFASFVSFFPQLVAGPIERATNLLPQILNNRLFNYKQCVQGVRLINWGIFKKVVIADSLSPEVDSIFQNYSSLDGGVLLLGIIYFSFQIYCDFSGYSDIAIGTAKLLGIELMSNFEFPYFSKNITEFWRKWHISLSKWINEYLFNPMAFSLRKYRSKGLVISILITFSVVGLWHGSNWTFVIFGFLHGIAIVFDLITKSFMKKHKNIFEMSLLIFLQQIITFFYVCFTFLIFRSENYTEAFNYLYSIIQKPFGQIEKINGLIYVTIILVMDWLKMKDQKKSTGIIDNTYIQILIFWIIVFHSFERNQLNFIYFQF